MLTVEDIMVKNKAVLIFCGIILSLFIKNASFAIEDATPKTLYPDYAYEFTGKDKWENFNRKVFLFNLKANKYIIRPINIIWASILPKYGIDRVESFYTNLKYPIRLTSCLLQNDYKSSGTETLRFLTNTTLGLAGLYDPAKKWFNIEPRNEDIEQALAYRNVKRGNYLVLPIVTQGNTRDVAGYFLDLPLNPCSYLFFIGPASMISAGVSYVNDATIMQPITKMADTYADPYEVSKKFIGIDQYIKVKNLDREKYFDEKTEPQNIINVNTVSDNSNLKADIALKDYNPQSPYVTSMRSMLFDNQNLNDSMWSELSIWNKSFIKQIKTSSVQITPEKPNYKYRYILQQDKNAPVAILYPSIGENIMSSQSTVLAKILYDEGYSVVIQGSAFHWEFVKSMPDDYKPGFPYQDAYYSRLVTYKILNKLQNKNGCNLSKKIIVGSSFGALTTLFAASEEANDNKLGISKYIVINPPIEIFFALKQIDKICQDWKNNPSDIKLRAAVTTEKVVQLSQKIGSKDDTEKITTLPLNDDEAEIAIGFVMMQKLSDVVFTVEKAPKNKTSDIYNLINNLSFYDYAQKYLISQNNKPLKQLNYEASLYSLSDFLQNSNKYKLYHSLDDCFVNPTQLSWLKEKTGNKSVFFSNGSHLGFMYRKEFLDEFKKDIKL